MAVQNPVIVIPGITASDLHDGYPLRTETLWSMVLNHDYLKVALHPDDLRYEAIEPAHVFPGRTFEIYDGLIRALRHELSPRADQPTPVFAFPYDWRVDVRFTARALGDFIDEVIARTLLLKHYKTADETLKVDLVGHSMGGLIVTEHLAQAGGDARVGKVATLGTPFLGAVEAVVKITTGMSVLAGSTPSERERETARVTPAVYQLLPSYQGAAINPRGEDVDLFDPGNIQRSVVDSLTEFVRLYSVRTPAGERDDQAGEILARLLAAARAHRETVDAFDPATAGLAAADWLAIAGVGERTRVQFTVQREEGQPWFIVDDTQFVNGLERDPTSWQTGDGTVPLPGAVPPFLPPSQLVCVMEKDLGFLELRDRFLTKVGGFHGLLPGVNLVQRLVTRHLRPGFRGRVWGRSLPGQDDWTPPIRGLERKVYEG